MDPKRRRRWWQFRSNGEIVLFVIAFLAIWIIVATIGYKHPYAIPFYAVASLGLARGASIAWDAFHR